MDADECRGRQAANEASGTTRKRQRNEFAEIRIAKVVESLELKYSRGSLFAPGQYINSHLKLRATTKNVAK